MSQGAPGPYFNTGFKIRNIFGGFEVFEANFRYSQEGQLSTFLPSDVVFRARDLSVTGAFTISKILFPIRLSSRLFEYNPKTRFIFSINALKRPEYIRNLVKGALNYSLQLSPTSQIGVSPIDVTVNITPPNALNANYLEQLIQFSGLGQSVIRSFQTAVVTNFNAYYMYNNNLGGQRKRAKYFRLNAEYGGELLHRILNNVLNKENGKIGDFQTFRYFRSTADLRYYQPTSKKTIVAMRLSGGVSIPIGNSNILPWEKYNFAGGSNSIRAWLPRRLGPGNYAPENTENPNDLRTEQPGELIMEASIEVRRKIIGFFEGALFADAGNVWSIYKDEARPGAVFTPLFIKQLALGAGIGFRFDFSFLIIRIDAATKIYNPAFTDPIEKWTVRNLSWKKPFGTKGQTLLNVGIGYPF
jgi:outer membrane protein assembly factor BamA